jgi:hypothetical protein
MRVSRKLLHRAQQNRIARLAKALKPAPETSTGFAPTSGSATTERASERRWESWDGLYRVTPTPMAVGFQPAPQPLNAHHEGDPK